MNSQSKICPGSGLSVGTFMPGVNGTVVAYAVPDFPRSGKSGFCRRAGEMLNIGNLGWVLVQRTWALHFASHLPGDIGTEVGCHRSEPVYARACPRIISPRQL